MTASISSGLVGTLHKWGCLRSSVRGLDERGERKMVFFGCVWGGGLVGHVRILVVRGCWVE